MGYRSPPRLVVISTAILTFFLFTTTLRGDDDYYNTQMDFQADCNNDLTLYCPSTLTESTQSQLACLYDHSPQSDLSSNCRSFLATTTSGACDEDVQEYCSTPTSSYDTVDEIQTCLEQNTAKLSIDCYRNVMSYKNKANSNANESLTYLSEEQIRIRRITQIVSVIGMILIAIPLLLVIKVYRKAKNEIHNEDKSVLNPDLSVEDLLKLSCGIEPRKKSSTNGEATDIEGNDTQTTSLDPVEPWCISFYQLSYYAYNTADQSLWQTITCRKKERKAILNKVSCVLIFVIDALAQSSFVLFRSQDSYLQAKSLP